MSDFFWFSDAQWARIGPLLPRITSVNNILGSGPIKGIPRGWHDGVSNTFKALSIAGC